MEEGYCLGMKMTASRVWHHQIESVLPKLYLSEVSWLTLLSINTYVVNLKEERETAMFINDECKKYANESTKFTTMVSWSLFLIYEYISLIIISKNIQRHLAWRAKHVFPLTLVLKGTNQFILRLNLIQECFECPAMCIGSCKFYSYFFLYIM